MFRSVSRLGAIIAVLSAGCAHAATVTRTYEFSATNFVNVLAPPPPFFGPFPPPEPVPVPVLTGSITLTFDEFVSTSNQTFGIVVNSLNVPQGSPAAFSYTNVPFLGILPNVQIGGSLSTVNVVTSNTNDFFLEFNNILTETPTLRLATYALAGRDGAWSTSFGSVTSFVGVPNAVPEPATWALMISGFGLIGGVARRRRARGAFA